MKAEKLTDLRETMGRRDTREKDEDEDCPGKLCSSTEIFLTAVFYYSFQRCYATTLQLV